MNSAAVKHHEDLLFRLKDSASKFLSVVRKKFGIKLDYSEQSLYASDILLALFFKDRRAHDLAVTIIGSYLGELLIDNLGGKWELRDLSVVKIGLMKGVAYPFRQARKRLEKGFGEVLTGWYAKLKMDFCHDGELSWNGKSSTSLYNQLIAQNWDLHLLQRVMNEEEKSYVREEAAHLLGRLKSARIGPILSDQLFSSEQAYYACIAMQGIRDPQALPQLRELCRKEADVATRIQAIQAVGEYQDHASIPLLAEMINDKDEVVCHYASQALAKIGGEVALKALLEIMSNQRPGNRICAISALELIGDRACVPYLIECLFDKKEEICEAATRAFQYIPDARALKSLLQILKTRSSRLRILAAYALVFIGSAEALGPLRDLVKDSVKDVREHAAYLVPLLEAGTKPAGYCW